VNSSSKNPLALSYQDAAHVVQQQAAGLRPSHVEPVALLDSLGCTLARPVIADRNQPPFDRSTRDGFACRSADLTSLHPLEIVGRLRAGEIWTGAALEPGQVIEIMTGAPVPAGANCVLMVEHARVEDSRINPTRTLNPGENIVPAGAEARSGATLIEPGTRIGPQHIALAAACGYETISAYARPRVAILATGDELVPLGQQPLPHQIRNSNSYSLAAQITHHGGHPIIHPAVRDTLEASESSIRAALDCDLLILSGGVSMGKYDFVEQALANLNAEFFFTGARIQPGRPVVFGRLPEHNLYFFGLPGNPVSTLVTFALFAAPILAALAGQKDLGPQFAQAMLTQSVEAKPTLTRFLPAHLESSANGATIQPIPWHGSGDQSSAAKTTCFLVVPENAALKSGDTATFLYL
jgi:molybdopterin molybdotransferase